MNIQNNSIDRRPCASNIASPSIMGEGICYAPDKSSHTSTVVASKMRCGWQESQLLGTATKLERFAFIGDVRVSDFPCPEGTCDERIGRGNKARGGGEQDGATASGVQKRAGMEISCSPRGSMRS